MKNEAAASDIESELARLLPSVREAIGLPTFEIVLRPEWRAHRDRAFRLQLREALLANLKSHGAGLSSLEELALLDLAKPPLLTTWSTSISHCPEAGGYAFVNRASSPVRIGFDVEVTSRVARPIVARVSSDAELNTAPTPAHLWAAKEATFKALLNEGDDTLQPQTASVLMISDWSALDDQIWTFRASLTKLQHPIQVVGIGTIFNLRSMTIGLFSRITGPSLN